MTDQQERKFMKAMDRMAKAMERVADALETPMVGLPVEGAVELQAVGITWEDAVCVIRDACKEAPECGPDCVMYEWCQANIPDGPAPYEWEDPSGAGD